MIFFFLTFVSLIYHYSQKNFDYERYNSLYYRVNTNILYPLYVSLYFSSNLFTQISKPRRGSHNQVTRSKSPSFNRLNLKFNYLNLFTKAENSVNSFNEKIGAMRVHCYDYLVEWFLFTLSLLVQRSHCH